jgi:serine/threonine-protein kinase RsbW
MQNEHFFELGNDLTGVGRVVDVLIERCRRQGFDEERLRLNLRVGVTEALINAILYGNCRDPAKRVRLEARVAADAVVVRISDEGGGFDPDAVPDPTLPGNRTRSGGRGLFLIRALMDEVEFNPRGNAITMILRSASKPTMGA